MRRAAFALTVAAALAGCESSGSHGSGTPGSAGAPSDAATIDQVAGDTGAGDSATFEAGAADATLDTTPDAIAEASPGEGGAPESGADAGTGNWHLTVYFTAVESYFSGAAVEVTGCLTVDCSASGDPDNVIGSYPSEFVDTVQAEGTGQVSSGVHNGQYLNWSAGQPGSGYWLDQSPRDAQGQALVAYVSAAAHPSYAYGAAFSVLACGVDSTNAEPMDPQACSDLKNGAWVVRDRFESDTEVRHLDLYIGLQDRADMNTNPHFVDQVGALTRLP